jgi:putative FmdB family regulatory protein
MGGHKARPYEMFALKFPPLSSLIRSAMPIYAFTCTACGHAFDKLQKISDPDPEVCPACGKATVKRQLTAPSFRLSGSGWYETDFKKDGDKKRNLAGDGGESKPAETKPADSKPAESKPAESAPAKTESKPVAVADKA